MCYICELLTFLFYFGEFDSIYCNKYSVITHIFNS